MILGNFKKIVFGLFVGVTCLIIYRYNPYRIEFIGYYDKAFAHRVNNIEKLNSSLNFFNGVELDLVFQKNTLDKHFRFINLYFITFNQNFKAGFY